MAEAVRAVLRFGFEQMALDLISATCYPDNPASVSYTHLDVYKRQPLYSRQMDDLHPRDRLFHQRVHLQAAFRLEDFRHFGLGVRVLGGEHRTACLSLIHISRISTASFLRFSST